MKREVIVDIRNNYGREAIYPANEAAKVFAEIAGTKTLTRDALKKIKALGYEVKVLEKELEL